MTSRPPKLVASDLDGTLLRSDGTASPRTVRAVKALQETGLRFVVATARPPRWMHDLPDIVGAHGLAICSNGAFSYDVHARQVLSERTIDKATVLDLVARLREAVPGIVFAVENRLGFGMESTYLGINSAGQPGFPIGELSSLLDPLPGKLLARAPSLDQDEFLRLVTQVVDDRAVMAFSGTDGLAEISAVGITKAAILADWCASWGVSADEVVAFGDMPNDVAMLGWAGTSYAVANAHPEVVAAATHRCPSNDDDGVATILEAIAITAGNQRL